jgi:hypothetical protein
MRMRRYDQLDRAAAADGGRSVAMAVVVAEEDEDRGGRGEGIHQCRLPTKGRIPVWLDVQGPGRLKRAQYNLVGLAK